MIQTPRLTPKKKEILNSMQIYDGMDILMNYPFRYENHEQVPVEKWNVNDKIFTTGMICSAARVIRFGGKKKRNENKQRTRRR